jgi:hypothetical protein
MIWVNMAVPVIKMDRCMYRQSILYMVPIGLSMLIIVFTLVPLIYRACSNMEHEGSLD